MKAFLLAAGPGTRLLPLTNEIPKCLVPVNGIPLLSYWFHLFRKYGIDEIIINVNHLPAKVSEFIDKNANGLNIRLFYEEKLLGSLGTIMKNLDFFSDDYEDIFIFYSDNLTNINIQRIYDFHVTNKSNFTMGLFHTNKPESCGIAQLDTNNTIIDFVEKPLNPKSDLANAGIYITKRGMLTSIPLDFEKLLDIGFDLLPRFAGQMKGYILSDFIIDIGTFDNLALATEMVRRNPTLFNFHASE